MTNRTGTDSICAGMGAVVPVRWSSITIAVQVCGHTVTVRPPTSTLCSRPRLKRRSAANRASELSGFHCCGSHPGCTVQADDFRLPTSQKLVTPLRMPHTGLSSGEPGSMDCCRSTLSTPVRPIGHHQSGGSVCLVGCICRPQTSGPEHCQGAQTTIRTGHIMSGPGQGADKPWTNRWWA